METIVINIAFCDERIDSFCTKERIQSLIDKRLTYELTVLSTVFDADQYEEPLTKKK